MLVEIVDAIPHPDFKYPRVYNDIGLLRLKRKITFNKDIRPACLSSIEISEKTSQVFVVFGRGMLEGGPDGLQQYLTKQYY